MPGARGIGIAALFLAASIAGATAGNAIPDFKATDRCPINGTTGPVEACTFLREVQAPDLKAPAGGRAYRESWMGPFSGKIHKGSIELIITADEKRFLKTPWHRGVYRLKLGELENFEAMIAQSDFGTLPVYNRADDVCVDGVATALEAIVNGKYRLVYFDFCGGVSSNNIADALDQLFVLAASKAGLQYPVNPQHPTFRGY